MGVITKSLNTQEKARFFLQMSTLLKSGLSLQRSLSLAGKDLDRGFQSYLQSVSLVVGQGRDLASALALNQSYLDTWTINLLRLAEYQGSLVETCQGLAENAKDEQRHKRLYRSIKISLIATIWSILTLIAAIFMETPNAILKAEFWLRSTGVGVFLWGISFVIFGYVSRGSQQFWLKIPIIGKIVEAKSLVNLSQLRLPLSCGVSLLSALELVREHLRDPLITHILKIAAKKVRLGQPLSVSLQGQISPVAMQIIYTGEETGNLDKAMENLAQYYEGELERRLGLLQISLRPISLLAMGGLVAIVGIRLISTLLNSLPE